MELDRIEKLLEAYFEGATNLEEEAVLLDYFNHHKVADHLLQYKPIFVGMMAARKEKSTRKVQIDNRPPTKKLKTWWFAVAAIIVVAIGIGSIYLSQPRISQQEREALLAFENSRKAMILLSENFNKGAQQLYLVNQFDAAKDKIWKEDSE